MPRFSCSSFTPTSWALFLLVQIDLALAGYPTVLHVDSKSVQELCWLPGFFCLGGCRPQVASVTAATDDHCYNPLIKARTPVWSPRQWAKGAEVEAKKQLKETATLKVGWEQSVKAPEDGRGVQPRGMSKASESEDLSRRRGVECFAANEASLEVWVVRWI